MRDPLRLSVLLDCLEENGGWANPLRHVRRDQHLHLSTWTIAILDAATRLPSHLGRTKYPHRALLRGFNNLFESCGEPVIDLVGEVTVWQIAARVIGRNDRMRTQIRNLIVLKHRFQGLE